MPLFTEITIALVLAAAFGFIAYLLRQPPIIGFILAGLVVGLVASPDQAGIVIIENLAPIGVALLLFLVGLELNLKDLKHVGIPALITGLGQIAFTFGVGYLIASALGFALIPAIYIAIALTFSSTIIIIKLLSEKRELTSLYGRIVVGFLLIQDFVAILALVVLAGLQGEGSSILDFALTVVRGAILVVVTFLGSRFLPRLLDRVGRSQEMLYLFSIAWVMGVAAITEAMGLSIEVGGFLAGVALANSSEHFQIGARMRPIRDFFLILFFVGLGTKMLVAGVAVPWLPALALSLFVLVGNPIIVMILMGSLGYGARTSFLASLTVAQISEFSLIIAALGLRLGHIDATHTALITLVGIVTIFASSYFIIYGEGIYKRLKPILKFFEFRKKLIEDTSIDRGFEDHVALIGVHRTGSSIMKTLIDNSENFVALDFDPVVVKDLKSKDIPVVYGDIGDEEIQDIVGLTKARLIISTVPNKKDNMTILKLLKNKGGDTRVVVTALSEEDAREFYKAGANYVIMPHFVGGWDLAKALGGGKGFDGLVKLQERDARVLDLRGHSHKGPTKKEA
ncbi:MAG: cation:proton antiporter family protein [Candidatus Colwellbacteria bacterium]